ncbi:MAG: hypothetical protein H0T46_32620 [Deltaproteobacteria bacterium]|nr:hypothetical protein [Deltaproteobacteria bacterium]
MNDQLVSHTVFVWFLTLFTGIVAFTWFVYDAIKLLRLRKEDGRDPVVHDKRFGYGIGVVIGAVGVLGVLKYHLA